MVLVKREDFMVLPPTMQVMRLTSRRMSGTIEVFDIHCVSMLLLDLQ